MKTKHGILILTQHPEQKGMAIINNDMTAGILCGMRCEDIIRAVNSHDALVEACEVALTAIEVLYRHTKPLSITAVDVLTERTQEIEQAIDRAKENL